MDDQIETFAQNRASVRAPQALAARHRRSKLSSRFRGEFVTP
jgi:hypothetical protein